EPRLVSSARTLTSNSSRCTAWSGSNSTILSTLTSLFNCLVTCSSALPCTDTRMVIRDISGCSVGPTANDSMLKPRRLNSPDTRASTPGLFSTSTDRVWIDIGLPFWVNKSDAGVEVRPDAAGRLDLVVGRSGRHHRPDHGVLADGEVHHHRLVVDGHRLGDGGIDIGLGFTAQSDAAQRVGQLDEVRDALPRTGTGLMRGV